MAKSKATSRMKTAKSTKKAAPKSSKKPASKSSKPEAAKPPAIQKETIYIDIDDEVTAVIDKVVTADGVITAIVLPKKAPVFLSQVNIKLIKRAADTAKKKPVFITSDPAILALASSAGVPTAPTLTSKPTFPEEPVASTDEVTVDLQEDTAPAAKDVPAQPETASTDDAIELDNTVAVKAQPDEPAQSTKKDAKLKIPDFSSFRLRLVLGSLLLVGLGVAWFVGFVVLPEAKILVNADISSVSVDERITLDVDAAAVDAEAGVVPVQRVQVEKINDVTVPATGEKNVGEKATGVLNLENCIDSGEQEVLPAGTRFSAGSLTFVTTEQAIFQPAITDGTNCFSKELGRDLNVNVEAIEAGPAFNIAEQEFVSSISGIFAVGGPMSGGTTEVIKVVSQDDVDQAKAQIEGASRAEALAELQQELRDLGVEPIVETLAEGEPKTVFSPGIDDEATEVKVTTTITYNLVGVVPSDVQSIVDAAIANAIQDEQKNIRDNGASTVAYTLVDGSNNAAQIVQLRAVASVGPDINVDTLRTEVVGLKRGEIENLIESIDGVRSVSVEYSPGWITTTPKDAEKITIELVETNDQ